MTCLKGTFTVEETIRFCNVATASLEPPPAGEYFQHFGPGFSVQTYGVHFPPQSVPPMMNYYRTHFSGFQFTDVYTYHVELHALHNWLTRSTAKLID